jgi:hypothetical protein
MLGCPGHPGACNSAALCEVPVPALNVIEHDQIILKQLLPTGWGLQ